MSGRTHFDLEDRQRPAWVACDRRGQGTSPSRTHACIESCRVGVRLDDQLAGAHTPDAVERMFEETATSSTPVPGRRNPEMLEPPTLSALLERVEPDWLLALEADEYELPLEILRGDL